DEYGRVVVNAIINQGFTSVSLRKTRLELLHLGLDGLGGLDGVRAGQLKDRHGDGGFTVEVAVDVVVLGADLDAFFTSNRVPFLVILGIADQVLELNGSAGLASLDDNVRELFFRDESAAGVDGELKANARPVRDRRLAEPAGGDLPVLLADGVEHVG